MENEPKGGVRSQLIRTLEDKVIQLQAQIEGYYELEHAYDMLQERYTNLYEVLEFYAEIANYDAQGRIIGGLKELDLGEIARNELADQARKKG